jgi:hypothetical protein
MLAVISVVPHDAITPKQWRTEGGFWGVQPPQNSEAEFIEQAPPKKILGTPLLQKTTIKMFAHIFSSK